MICENLVKSKKIAENIKSFLSTQGALRYIEMTQNFPEILFLDINFSGEPNGWTFLEKFKILISKTKKKTAIYILSSSVATIDIKKAKSDTAIIDYINKPLTVAKLDKIL